MKKVFLILVVILGLLGCEKEEKSFSENTYEENYAVALKAYNPKRNKRTNAAYERWIGMYREIDAKKTSGDVEAVEDEKEWFEIKKKAIIEAAVGVSAEDIK